MKDLIPFMTSKECKLDILAAIDHLTSHHQGQTITLAKLLEYVGQYDAKQVENTCIKLIQDSYLSGQYDTKWMRLTCISAITSDGKKYLEEND